MVKVCDCFPELKDITDARERRYRAHPEKPAPEGPRGCIATRRSGPMGSFGSNTVPDTLRSLVVPRAKSTSSSSCPAYTLRGCATILSVTPGYIVGA